MLFIYKLTGKAPGDILSPYFHTKRAKQDNIPICCAIFFAFLWNPLFILYFRAGCWFSHQYDKYSHYTALQRQVDYVHCLLCILFNKHRIIKKGNDYSTIRTQMSQM